MEGLFDQREFSNKIQDEDSVGLDFVPFLL